MRRKNTRIPRTSTLLSGSSVSVRPAIISVCPMRDVWCLKRFLFIGVVVLRQSSAMAMETLFRYIHMMHVRRMTPHLLKSAGSALFRSITLTSHFEYTHCRRLNGMKVGLDRTGAQNLTGIWCHQR